MQGIGSEQGSTDNSSWNQLSCTGRGFLVNGSIENILIIL